MVIVTWLSKCLCVIFSQVDVVAEYRKREESGKPQVNLVVIGECMFVSVGVWSVMIVGLAYQVMSMLVKAHSWATCCF